MSDEKKEKTKTAVAKQATAAAPATTEKFNPFARKDQHLNAGTVAIEESRAVAEAMGKLYVAKHYPRNEAASYEKIMLSCGRAALAESAEYSYPKGGKNITGASIRLAEELARAWGNIEYGLRELSQRDGESEMEAYCWDLETNTLSSQKFTVKHERSAGGQIKRLVDQRDIYENNANNGARRLRARILAVLPPDLVEDALDTCKRTLVGDVKQMPDRIKKMLVEFKKLNVTEEMLEKRMSKKVNTVNADELGELISIYNSLKDGISTPADWFEVGAADTQPGTAAGDLNAELKKDAPLV